MGTPEPETPQLPFPDRIISDIGCAFGAGVVGGSASHFLKGVYNAPTGSRFLGGSQAVRMNALRVGGICAAFGGLYATFDCTMGYARQKNDPWNTIFAATAAGGFLKMRQGLCASARSALLVGTIVALFEGAYLITLKDLYARENMHRHYPLLIEDPWPRVGSSSDSGWFGGRKKKEEVRSGGAKTEILESSNAPPVPSFELK